MLSIFREQLLGCLQVRHFARCMSAVCKVLHSTLTKYSCIAISNLSAPAMQSVDQITTAKNTFFVVLV